MITLWLSKKGICFVVVVRFRKNVTLNLHVTLKTNSKNATLALTLALLKSNS